MLFNYRYLENHRIERFQVYLDHLVKNVWCQAAGDFSVDLLHDDLREIVLEIYNTDEHTTRGKVSDWLFGPIRTIFELFKTRLTPAQRAQVADWFDSNNDIEALCAADPAKVPATYSDIRAIDADLANALKEFCTSLFTDVIHLKAVTRRIGEIDQHYDDFVAVNVGGKCPYCGFADIKGLHHSRREAYDHYLPKGTYPFNSVNFRNLAPMCHECNSSYKLGKDVTRHLDPINRKAGGNRRRAFYPYAAGAPGITISLKLRAADVSTLEPGQIDLEVVAPGRDEEVEAWTDVFGIEERYKAKLCGVNDGKAWLVQVCEEAANVSLTPGEMLAAKRKAAEAQPFVDANFLKIPFLQACQDARMI